jgi:hypothetical protein
MGEGSPRGEVLDEPAADAGVDRVAARPARRIGPDFGGIGLRAAFGVGVRAFVQ